jgi:hypothetical protein
MTNSTKKHQVFFFFFFFFFGGKCYKAEGQGSWKESGSEPACTEQQGTDPHTRGHTPSHKRQTDNATTQRRGGNKGQATPPDTDGPDPQGPRKKTSGRNKGKGKGAHKQRKGKLKTPRNRQTENTGTNSKDKGEGTKHTNHTTQPARTGPEVRRHHRPPSPAKKPPSPDGAAQHRPHTQATTPAQKAKGKNSKRKGAKHTKLARTGPEVRRHHRPPSPTKET